MLGVAALTEEWAAECVNNRVDQVTEGFEEAVSFDKDEAGQIVSVLDGAASSGVPGRAQARVDMAYDGFGRLVRRTAASGVSERWGYDSRGRVTWEATFAPLSATTQPSPGGMATTQPATSWASLDPSLVAYGETSYDDDDRPTVQRSLWFTRDAQGLAVPKGSGWTTESWSYDDPRRRVTHTAADGSATVTTYDALGRVDEVRRPDGTLLQDRAYSDLGRTVVVTTPDASVSTGQRVETHRYLPFGALATVEDGLANILRHDSYDRLGRRLTTRDRATGFRYEHDDFGRAVVRQRLNAAGQAQEYERYGYTAAGRPTTYKDAMGRETTSRYDGQGRLRELLQPGGVESWAYYAGTQLAREHVNRANEVVSLEYDAYGAVSRVWGRRGTLNSYKAMLNDATGLRTARSWTVDGSGATTADVTTSFDYDSLGSVVVERSSVWTDPVEYSRDGLGRWTQLQIGTTQLGRSFDAFGRLDAVRLGPTRVFADYVYPAGASAASQVVFANGAVETRSYDARGRTKSRAVRLGATTVFQQDWMWGVDDVLARWDSVSPSPVGRRSFVFRADDVGRLSDYALRLDLTAPASGEASATDVTGWLGSGQRERYVVDASDRLLEKWVGSAVTRPTYGTDGRLVGWGTTPATSDAEGRLTSMATTTLEYDALGRMSASGSGTNRTTYLYDAMDNLVGWNGPAAATARFQRADGQIVRDRDGATTRVMIPGDGLVPIATITGGVEVTNVEGPGDRLVAALNNSGALAERYETLGHATPVFWSGVGQPRSVSALGNRLLLAGQPYAAHINAHRQGLRWYRPDWGRFLSSDPLGHFDGPNTFAYGGMNPIRWTDPFGLARESEAPDDENSPASLIGEFFWGRPRQDLRGLGYTQMGGLELYSQCAGPLATGNVPSDVCDRAADQAKIDAVELGFELFSAGIAGYTLGTPKLGLGAPRGAPKGRGPPKGRVDVDYAEQAGYEAPLGASAPPPPPQNAAPTPAAKAPPNPGGRLGKQATRDHVDRVATELEARGWQITGGGNRLPEEYLPGPGGARTGSSLPDITATKNGRTLRVNTVDTLRDGQTPDSRERRNAARIRRQRPGDHLLLIPKP
jgi:RHS repeat-associated protein